MSIFVQHFSACAISVIHMLLFQTCYNKLFHFFNDVKIDYFSVDVYVVGDLG